MSQLNCIGLDLETTGSDINDGAVPIQLGLAFGDDMRAWEIDPESCGEYTWSAEAEGVHGLKEHDVLAYGLDVKVVDCLAVAWLYEVGALATGRMNRQPVGWNVAGFDMAFIDRYMPNLRSVLSYRTIDLNAVCAVLGGLLADNVASLKKHSKRHVNDMYSRNGEQVRWHDAGFDAKAALISLDYLMCERYA